MSVLGRLFVKNPPAPSRAEVFEQEWRKEMLLEEPCEMCLAYGWHWIAFSGDLCAWRESCLVPGSDLPGARSNFHGRSTHEALPHRTPR